MKKSSFFRFITVGIGLFVLSGCVPQQRGVPSWLIHVPRQPVDTTVSIDAAKDRLVYEIGQAHLPANYIPPEQIARFAVQLIEQNEALDATVFLAAASYTYHRQAILAVTAAEQSAPRHLANATQQGVDAYWDFVHDEFRTFRKLDFLDQLDYTVALWEKKKQVFEQLEKELAQIYGSPGAGGTNRQDAMKEELTRKIETARSPNWSRLKYPEVAQALLERLKADLSSEKYQFDAALHLAAVPFEPFLLTALQEASHPFMVPMCRSIGLRFAVYEQPLLDALHAARPETRSNAALILGLRAGEKYLPTLEQAYVNESDILVRWSLEYAMIVAGKKDLLPLFYSHTSQAVDEEHVDHLIHLYEWLPEDAVDGLSEAWLHQLATAEKQSYFARTFAMMVLGNIGERKNIRNDTLNMLLIQSVNEDEDISEWAHRSVIRQKILDRTVTQNFLSQNSRGTDALLNRMLILTEEKDFPFWQAQAQSFSKLSDPGKRMTIFGLAQSGKVKAVPALKQLFNQYRDHRLTIAAAYSDIPGMAAPQLLELAQQDNGAAAVFLRFAAEQRALAAEQLGTLLTTSPFGEKIAATQLAKMFVAKEQKTALLGNTDYHDTAYYPHDSILRNSSLDALLTIAIVDAFQKTNYDFNTPQLEKK